jgi:hypothetical protein
VDRSNKNLVVLACWCIIPESQASAQEISTSPSRRGGHRLPSEVLVHEPLHGDTASAGIPQSLSKSEMQAVSVLSLTIACISVLVARTFLSTRAAAAPAMPQMEAT